MIDDVTIIFRLTGFYAVVFLSGFIIDLKRANRKMRQRMEKLEKKILEKEILEKK